MTLDCLPLPLRRVFGAVALCLSIAAPAGATTLVIDDFDDPTPPSTSVLFAVGERSFNNFTPTVPGGVRGVYHHNYTNPLGSVAALSVGNGIVSASTGIGARTEVLLSWGAFTRPTGDPGVGGPLLALDARPYNAFQIDFTGVSQYSNLIAVLYTSAPLDAGNPLYYTTAAVNAAPAVPGGPMSVTLPFTGDPNFNWSRVDGILLEIDRANSATNLSWNLDRLALVTVVPEPGAGALLLAGLAVVGWMLRRQRG